MSSFIKWIAMFLLCSRCVFSNESVTDEYNLTNKMGITNRDVAVRFSSRESVTIDAHSRNKDLTTKNGVIEATTSPKQNDWINSLKMSTSKVMRNLDGDFILKAIKIKKSPQLNREAVRNIPISYLNFLRLAEKRHTNSPGIFDSPTSLTEAIDGSYCETALDCPNWARCVNGECVCLKGYIKYMGSCLLNLRGICKTSQECPGDLFCSINGTCICGGNFIREGSKCVKPNLGKCEISTECPLYSECIDGLCICKSGYMKMDYKCVLITHPDDECSENYECQSYLKYSICDRIFNRNECRCLPDYIAADGECVVMASLGAYCKKSIQCPQWSFCIDNICICTNGYVSKGSFCAKEPYTPMPNFLLALIAGIVFLIVVSCLFVIIMALRRKLSRIRNASHDDPPTVSSVVDAGRLTPDPSYERVDKPPTYDEAMSSSTTLLTLNVQDIASEPPSYSQVQQQQIRNATIPSGT